MTQNISRIKNLSKRYSHEFGFQGLCTYFCQMANKYLTYISDEHLLKCIENLYNSYKKAQASITTKKFYSNKIDPIKFQFDKSFNGLDEESIIKGEIARQIDKSVNNAIGTFHEEILGGIEGYEMGSHSGYDIKATDNTLFAELKNKHNTMNSSAAESVFQKLEKFAETYPTSTCYQVQIWSTKSFNETWGGSLNGKDYRHPRVRKISGDKFYALLSGEKKSLYNLYKILPTAITDFLEVIDQTSEEVAPSAYKEIKNEAQRLSNTIVDQIAFDNFSYYLGFDSLK